MYDHPSMSSGVSSTREADEQGIDMFGLGSTGGGGAYGRENSASLRRVSIIAARAMRLLTCMLLSPHPTAPSM